MYDYIFYHKLQLIVLGVEKNNDDARRIMCSSRKYPYPHHGGNWTFQGGGGVKGPGNSGGEGGLEVKFTSKWKEINRLTSYVRLCHLPTFVGRSKV